MALSATNAPVLLLRVAERVCAAPLDRIGEVLRPLPVAPLAGAPAGVTGLAVIRGQPVPVVDLGLLLGAPAAVPAPDARFVTVRAGARLVAVLVQAVLSIRVLPAQELAALPPLWDGPSSPAIAALGVRDHQLLFFLEAARLLPEGDWLPPAAP